jgi:hypothetical protein
MIGIRLTRRLRLIGSLWIVLATTAPTASGADGLSYRFCESGLETPDWDGGDTELELADVDGDGHVDLVSVGDHGNPLINTDQEGILVWLGDGLGGWSHVSYGHLGYGGVAIGDVNGDGLQDVGYGIHHDYSNNDLGDQLLEVALGDGTGQFWTPWDDGLATHGENWGLFSTDFGDVDADGDLDVGSIGFGASSGLQIYMNDGNGTWRRSFGFLAGNSRHVLAFGDVDGDGHRDVVAAKEEGTVWLGDGDGFFEQADGNLPTPGGSSMRDGPSLGDIDGDGRDDLAFCDGADNAQVWLARGAGSWEDASSGVPATGTCEHTALEDMNGDGAIDLATFGWGELYVFAGDGSGSSWTEIAWEQTGDAPGHSQAFRVGGDADHNGRPDVAMVNEHELTWITDENRIHALCEASSPEALSVRLVSPGPNRVWLAGSTVFVEWATAVPAGAQARASIELSVDGPSGPWSPVASDLPDNGRYQWVVPDRVAEQAWLRITARTAGDTAEAVSPAPFRIGARPDPLHLSMQDDRTVGWTDDLDRERYNLYRGSWSAFLQSGSYTQDPGSVPAADRFCDLEVRSRDDDVVPEPGELTYYLVTAYRMRQDGTDPEQPVPMAEGPLGQRSGARMRPNEHRCPR